MPIDRTEDSGLFVVKESTCLSIEQLSELLDGSIEPAAAAAMRNHIRQCTFCRNELAMLVEFDEGRIEPKDLEVIEWMTKKLHRRVSREIGKTPGQESTFRRAKRLASRFSSPKLYLLPAAALLGILVFIFAWPEGKPPGITTHTPGSEVWRSGQLSVIAPAGPVAGVPEALQWHAAAGAIRYQVHLFEVDHTEIWRADSERTEVTLPLPARHQMIAGRTFLWRVEAFGAGGRRMGMSELQSFVVKQH